MGDLDDPVLVSFPLRGDNWMAVTTPAARIPSHGTDMLGQRYAYDFIRVDDRRGVHAHPASALRAATIGGRTTACYAWGAEIVAPFAGEVVAAVDGVSERGWINPLRENARAMWMALTFRPEKTPALLGNHVLLRSGDVFAAFAHLAPGTVAVAVGQRIEAGDVLGQVGHTGNSTMPHLHFQLMDSADLQVAAGIPCAFAAYEVRAGDGTWRRVERGVPGPRERVRPSDGNGGGSAGGVVAG